MRPKLGKDKILNAAVELFARKGFHATSVSQIATAAGVSKGLTYNYFKSKEELLLGIINQASESMLEVADDMDAANSQPRNHEETLRQFLDTFCEFLQSNEEYLSFQLSLLFQPDLKDIVQPPLQKRADHLLKKTETMFQEAGFPDANYTARRFMCELDGFTLHYLSVFEDYPYQKMLDQLFQNYKDAPTSD